MSTSEKKESPGLGITPLPLAIGIFGILIGFMFLIMGGDNYYYGLGMYGETAAIIFLWGGIIMAGIGGWLISKKLKKQKKENEENVDKTLDKF